MSHLSKFIINALQTVTKTTSITKLQAVMDAVLSHDLQILMSDFKLRLVMIHRAMKTLLVKRSWEHAQIMGKDC